MSWSVTCFGRFILEESAENLNRFFWQVNILRVMTKNYLSPFRREIVRRVTQFENVGKSVSEIYKGYGLQTANL